MFLLNRTESNVSVATLRVVNDNGDIGEKYDPFLRRRTICAVMFSRHYTFLLVASIGVENKRPLAIETALFFNLRFFFLLRVLVGDFSPVFWFLCICNRIPSMVKNISLPLFNTYDWSLVILHSAFART